MEVSLSVYNTVMLSCYICIVHCRWKECHNGSHYSGVRREGNYHQQEHFIATVYTNRLQVRVLSCQR